MIVHTLADPLLLQLLMDSLYTLLSITGTLEICMKKFDADFFLQNGCFVNLDNFSDLYQIS